jgi:nucleotide-binding universal stress UspA family protein
MDRAIALVASFPASVLHFVTVLDPRSGIPAVPPGGPIDFQYSERVREYMADEITRGFRTADVPADVQFFVHARIGSAAHEILELAKEIGADLIFIGTHGYTGLKHAMTGSVAERVVREAGCPVMVVRSKTYPDIELDTIVEVPDHKRPTSHLYRFSYTNHNVIMVPPDWTTR